MDAADPKPLRVVFCWAEVAGYMPSCWRELSRRPGVTVHVIHPRQLTDGVSNPFDLDPLMAGLSHDLFDHTRPDLDGWLLETVRRQQPDVIVICGWVVWPYLRLMAAPELARVRFVLGMDTPWQGSLRQRLGRWRLRGMARRVAAVMTAGARSAEYARRLGVPAGRIHRGFYGFDQDALAQVAERRSPAGSWPRQFLFVGRYIEAKDLDTLVAGYRQYRQQVHDPWGLSCTGNGPAASAIAGVEGIADLGFTQPAAMPEVFGRHGAFVIASRYEPWGVVLAEAAASGLPVVCTSVCGAADDIVREFYNGLIVAPGDAAALARMLRWIHEHESDLWQMGHRGRALADAFSARAWAVRWHHHLQLAIEDPA